MAVMAMGGHSVHATPFATREICRNWLINSDHPGEGIVAGPWVPGSYVSAPDVTRHPLRSDGFGKLHRSRDALGCADVLYAGVAPLSVAGFTQITRVPAGAPSGAAVSIVVTVGQANSLAGVTIAVQ
jgi:hypothetical protein